MLGPALAGETIKIERCMAGIAPNGSLLTTATRRALRDGAVAMRGAAEA